ncbi:replication fork protection component Swi3-domain-containing protein [Lactarius vividus]|nr:replication fork protection component Swi3-domain-containing protein [Lactarius vividus]
MDMDVDHIWDLPLEHSPATTTDPAPTNTSNQPLFLPSDDEGEAAATTQPSANNDPDIDALFDGIDDLDEFAPALDLDALRREADARNTRLVRAEISASIPTIQLSTTTSTTKSGDGQKGPLDGGDENDDGKKKRKPIAKLDEARLLGKNGLPQLVKDTKNFKPKGKGHEAADLDRVLQVYQFWTHRLYPKTRFKETVDRVEKLCHSKRMQVALSVWRDEAKGLVNGVRLPPQGDNNDDDNSDTDSDAIVPPPGDATATADDGGATSSSQPSSPARTRLRRARSATSDSEREGGGGEALSSDDASRPPPSSPDRDEAAIELDALLEEEARHAAAHAAQTSHAWKKSQASGDDVAVEADDGLWAALDATPAPAAAPTTAQASPKADPDEEMWDIVAELEQEQRSEAAPQSKPMQTPPAAVDTNADDDLDDLYL